MEHADQAEAFSAAADAGVESQCRLCGKRQSPSSSHHPGSYPNTCDAETEPRTKKPMLLHNHHPSPAFDSGYTEIKLPIEFKSAMNLSPAPDSPMLLRSVSDPYKSPGDDCNKNHPVALKPDGPLRRCISDPCHPPGDGTLATNSPARGMSPGGGLPPLYPNRPSPDSLRLKRMKERMQEMAQWCVDAVRDDDLHENHDAAPASQEDVSDRELEEQVSVEKVGGDSLKIKLRCPCGSGYELLISGPCCYYKIL